MQTNMEYRGSFLCASLRALHPVLALGISKKSLTASSLCCPSSYSYTLIKSLISGNLHFSGLNSLSTVGEVLQVVCHLSAPMCLCFLLH